MQVELDALDPALLRSLFSEAVDEFWDASTYETVLDRERTERARLTEVARELAGGGSDA